MLSGICLVSGSDASEAGVGKFFERLMKGGKQSHKPNVREVDYSQYPTSESVPRKIHYFWQGPIALFRKHVNAINSTAEINKASYEVRLHVVPIEGEKIADFDALLKHVKVKDLRQERWFADFKKTPRYAQFLASRDGERAHPASGADIIKSELIQRKGGVWNDVDNKPLKPLPAALSVPKGKVLTAGPVTFNRWGEVLGFHSSSFATHRGNDVLSAINVESFNKFHQLKNVIYRIHPQTDNPDEHFRMISETAGSLHFSRALMNVDPVLRKEIADLATKGEHFNQSLVIFDQYIEPVVTTGAGFLDKKQLETAVIAMSGQNAVFADDPNAVVLLRDKAKRGEKVHIVI
ncbi:glycosyltransferase family 32 protein [Pseudomonas khavaziana]|uniref:hypothetical protein n=1 Tax=Pseudomonas khavaziana TaxID=2842351 RepID=UPI001C3DB011|nr:hypothetical protein [Pseudomonas khavaziana]MBV4483807.1 hypothetical protein [Pseudomonas khavaziana]